MKLTNLFLKPKGRQFVMIFFWGQFFQQIYFLNLPLNKKYYILQGLQPQNHNQANLNLRRILQTNEGF